MAPRVIQSRRPGGNQQRTRASVGPVRARRSRQLGLPAAYRAAEAL